MKSVKHVIAGDNKSPPVVEWSLELNDGLPSLVAGYQGHSQIVVELREDGTLYTPPIYDRDFSDFLAFAGYGQPTKVSASE